VHLVPTLVIKFRKTGITLRKAVRSKTLPDGSNTLKNVKGEVTGGLFAMSSSPVTPTPPSATPRMAGARTLDGDFDLGAVIKQQQIERDLPVPPITASQISTCENALKQLKLKAKGNGGRNLNGAIDCEFDTLQTERMHNYKAISQTAVALSASNRAKNRYVNVLPCILEEMILICFVVVRLTGFVTRI